jgi:hypothetical protein
MALPLEPTNTQRGCTPLSSNCVIWQGPDISCINLCKGPTQTFFSQVIINSTLLTSISLPSH